MIYQRILTLTLYPELLRSTRGFPMLSVTVPLYVGKGISVPINTAQPSVSGPEE
jgi:hypothetical protein